LHLECYRRCCLFLCCCGCSCVHLAVFKTGSRSLLRGELRMLTSRTLIKTACSSTTQPRVACDVSDAPSVGVWAVRDSDTPQVDTTLYMVHVACFTNVDGVTESCAGRSQPDAQTVQAGSSVAVCSARHKCVLQLHVCVRERAQWCAWTACGARLP
jgi:hypothetical protein